MIAFGPIERTTIVALSSVRSLATFKEQAQSNTAEIDAEKTLALRRYLFALALASAADTGAWDLREGCILVRASKDENGKVVPEPSAFTSVKVKHSGEEETFEMPTKQGSADFLAKAAEAFFGIEEVNGEKKPKIPPPLVLAFDAGGARAAVSTKGGGSAGQPKSKDDFVKALIALPAYSRKEAELKKKKLPELKKMWEEAQKTMAEAPDATGTETAPTDDKATS